MLLNETLTETQNLFESETAEAVANDASELKKASITRALRAAVPLAQALGFRVDRLSPEQTVCSLPAREMALNQNGTFQASTFYILADYTAGLAMYAAIPGYSLFGLTSEPGAPVLQGWLKDGTVKHIRPATGEIRAVCEVSTEERDRIRADLQVTGRAASTGEVFIYQGETLVARARHTVVFKQMS